MVNKKMTEISRYINKILASSSLSAEEMARAFQIMSLGGASPAQISALLVGLRVRGENFEEILGAAKLLESRWQSIDIKEDVLNIYDLDTHGYDYLDLKIPLSIILAASSIKVALNGIVSMYANNSASQIIKNLEVNIYNDDQKLKTSLTEQNFCFGLMDMGGNYLKNIISVKGEFESPTLLNLVYPLANRVKTNSLVISVSNEFNIEMFLQVLKQLGFKRALVANNAEGPGYISTSRETVIYRLKDGFISSSIFNPAECGFKYENEEKLKAIDVAEKCKKIYELFSRQEGQYRDFITLNAAMCLMMYDKCNNIIEGIEMASKIIDSKEAFQKLEKIIEFSMDPLLNDNL